MLERWGLWEVWGKSIRDLICVLEEHSSCMEDMGVEGQGWKRRNHLGGLDQDGSGGGGEAALGSGYILTAESKEFAD